MSGTFDRDHQFANHVLNGRHNAAPATTVTPTMKGRKSRVASPPKNSVPVPVPYKGGTGTETTKERSDGFPPLLAASELSLTPEQAKWLWYGYVGLDQITLLSALWKAGKTTMLAHLMRAMQTGGLFCGLSVAKSKVLYVTEESGSLWADRRDRLGLTDELRFLVRPFIGKPDRGRWLALIAYVRDQLAEAQADLIVFDTLSALWPVRDENDAAQVQEALMPLRLLSEGRSLLLIHHMRKGDGTEATATRGSGALPSFVDTIVELRRFKADDRADRRRVLSAYGRYEATPNELVVELTDDGYTAHGDRSATTSADLAVVIMRILPADIPGWTADDVREAWPGGSPPHKAKVLTALRDGADRGVWLRAGEGKRGDPFVYWRK